MPRTIVLVHGMFMTPSCWDMWVARYSAAGRGVIAVAWPGRDRPVEELRASPDPNVGNLGLHQITEHVSSAVVALREPPVLIGHSMGGLVVQLLLARGLGAAGAAIDSAPPTGVFTAQPSFVKSNWPMINPLKPLDEPHLITIEEFSYAFANTLSPEEQIAAWERYTVPESRLIPHESLGKAGHVDFHAEHPPLLLVAGGADHITPAALNRANFKHYDASPSLTEYREYPGRDHLTITEPGWEQVADETLAWLDEHAES